MQPYIPDVAAESAGVIQAFHDALAPSLPDPALRQDLRLHLDDDCAALASRYQDWLVDEPAKHQLQQSAVALAAYLHLRGAVPDQELLGLLRAAFTEPLRAIVRGGTAQALDQAEDPFVTLVGISKLSEKHFHGESFVFERPRDDDRAYHLDVTRCLWQSFFVAEGCPELTAIFCAFDEAWIGAIEPGRHGLRFERATTLGEGGSLCPFHFFRVERASPTHAEPAAAPGRGGR
jgi:hypothetical protein